MALTKNIKDDKMVGMADLAKIANMKKTISFTLTLRDASLVCRALQLYLAVGGKKKFIHDHFVSMLNAFSIFDNLSIQEKKISKLMVENYYYTYFESTLRTGRESIKISEDPVIESLNQGLKEIIADGLKSEVNKDEWDEYGEYYQNGSGIEVAKEIQTRGIYFNFKYSKDKVYVSFSVAFYNKVMDFLNYSYKIICCDFSEIFNHPNFAKEFATKKDIEFLNDLENSFRTFYFIHCKKSIFNERREARKTIYSIKANIEETLYDIVSKSLVCLFPGVAEPDSPDKNSVLSALSVIGNKEVLVGILIQAERMGNNVSKYRALRYIRKIWNNSVSSLDKNNQFKYEIDKIIMSRAMSKASICNTWDELINYCLEAGLISSISTKSGRHILREERSNMVVECRK